MSRQPTLWDLLDATSLAELEAGSSLSTSPAGQPAAKSGPGRVRASRSRSRAKAKAKLMNATFGLSFDDSSPSADLQRSLASRLLQTMDVNGSPEYELTWKAWDMSSGPPICALRARQRLISDSDSSGTPSGYPTPDAVRRGGVHKPDAALKRMGRKGKEKHQANLQDVATLVGWHTPDTKPDRPNSNSNCTGAAGLGNQALLVGYSTPSSRDWKDTPGMATVAVNPDGSERRREDQLARQVHGAITTSSDSETARGAALNPALSAWLMGCPPELLHYAPGYWSWELMQRLLGGSSPSPSDIESAVSEASAMQFRPR